MKTGKAQDLILYLMNVDRNSMWDLSEHKEKRSMNQNSYYWKLCGEVAKLTRVSTNVIHNQNLRDLGLIWRINDEVIPVYLPDTENAEKEALNATTYHIKPTSQVKEGKDGKMFRCYVMLRGSSTFNVEEMSALLDLMIQEAKTQGIETMTPSELAHMRELERNAIKKNKGRGNNAESQTSG